METSAKTALNIDQMLKKLSQELIKRKKYGDSSGHHHNGTQLKLDKRSKPYIKRKCC